MSDYLLQDYRSDSPERTQWATMRNDLHMAYPGAYFSPPLTSASSSLMSPAATCASFDTTLDTEDLWTSGHGSTSSGFDVRHHEPVTTMTHAQQAQPVPVQYPNWQSPQNPQQAANSMTSTSAAPSWGPQSYAPTANYSWSPRPSPSLSVSSTQPHGGAHAHEAGLAPNPCSKTKRASPFASTASSVGSTSPDMRIKSPRLKVEDSRTPPDSSAGNSESNATTTSKDLRSKKPRRKAHNAIEKRYRVKLNEKITELRDSIPSLRASTGLVPEGYYEPDSPVEVTAPKINKAHILEKATEYVKELEASNRQLQAELYQERVRSGHTQALVGQSHAALNPQAQVLNAMPMATDPNGANNTQAWPYTYSNLVADDTTTMPRSGSHRR